MYYWTNIRPFLVYICVIQLQRENLEVTELYPTAYVPRFQSSLSVRRLNLHKKMFHLWNIESTLFNEVCRWQALTQNKSEQQIKISVIIWAHWDV